MIVGQRLTLHGYQPRVEARLRSWQAADFAGRLWARDPGLWSSVPVPEMTDRLGWLDLPDTIRPHLDDLAAFAREVRADGVRHTVLLGMGGSSLAPEVFSRTFGSAPAASDLIVLDSTHPAAVRHVASRIDPGRTLFLVSSKSGTTTETLSLFRFFWHRAGQVTAAPGGRFAAITDPETPLARLAAERRFSRVFLAPPDVGGRYSALTVFGLVPAALSGVDVRLVVDRAGLLAAACGPHVPAEHNPGLVLGAALGELALAGRDKLTLIASRSLEALPPWIEQLVAESTGKDGTGIVPVVDEPLAPPEAYSGDRVFVLLRLEGDDARNLDDHVGALEAAGHPVARIHLSERADLGQEYFRWEIAVAAAGAVLGIHPFNQPDVQLAKDLATQAMARESGGRSAADVDRGAADTHSVAVGRPERLAQAIRAWMAGVRPGDYIGLQAYLAPSGEITEALQDIRRKLRDRLRVATTSGYGPRFLHSTGQLHKGGPNSGVFLQFVDAPAEDVEVPETGYTFGALIAAQAAGDAAALRQRGRRVLRVHLGDDASAGLARVQQAVHEP